MFARKMMACVFSVVLAGVVTFGAAGTASACDPPCQYRKVTVYVCQYEPYQVCVTRFDHCGRPYEAYVTLYSQVQVPVIKWVKVCG